MIFEKIFFIVLAVMAYGEGPNLPGGAEKQQSPQHFPWHSPRTVSFPSNFLSNLHSNLGEFGLHGPVDGRGHGSPSTTTTIFEFVSRGPPFSILGYPPMTHQMPPIYTEEHKENIKSFHLMCHQVPFDETSVAIPFWKNLLVVVFGPSFTDGGTFFLCDDCPNAADDAMNLVFDTTTKLV